MVSEVLQKPLNYSDVSDGQALVQLCGTTVISEADQMTQSLTGVVSEALKLQ